MVPLCLAGGMTLACRALCGCSKTEMQTVGASGFGLLELHVVAKRKESTTRPSLQRSRAGVRQILECQPTLHCLTSCKPGKWQLTEHAHLSCSNVHCLWRRTRQQLQQDQIPSSNDFPYDWTTLYHSQPLINACVMHNVQAPAYPPYSAAPIWQHPLSAQASSHAALVVHTRAHSHRLAAPNRGLCLLMDKGCVCTTVIGSTCWRYPVSLHVHHPST